MKPSLNPLESRGHTSPALEQAWREAAINKTLLPFGPQPLFVWIALLLILAGTSASCADPLPVTILDTQYRISLTSYWDYPLEGVDESRAQVSTSPISDSFYSSVGGQVLAQASANLFSIWVLSDRDGPHRDAYATAEAVIRFSPLLTGTNPINIEFESNNHWYWCAGSVTLTDLTASQTVWSYESFVNVPWDVQTGLASLWINTEFNVADTYELSFNWRANTGGDPGLAQTLIRLYGLEPIPEPSAIALLGVGSLVLAMLRRRR